MIKPYFNFQIDVKNLSSYQDFLKKRPKKAQQFKFTMIRDRDEFTRADEKQIQLKLLKALKIVKPVSKVDLGDCEIIDYAFWEPKLLYAFKTISHIKTFFVMGPKRGFQMNYFQYFPKLKNIFYKLNNYYFLYDYAALFGREEPLDAHYDLKSLKYCPKIRSLGFADFSCAYYSRKVAVEPNRSLRALKSLHLRGESRKEDQFEFPIDLCQNLESVSLNFPNLDAWESLPQILNILSKLPRLQEIKLNPIISMTLDSLRGFKKITKKGMLKKVQFNVGDWTDESEKMLKALKTCQLTDFHLEVDTEIGIIKPLSQFLQDMDHLESLELHIVYSYLELENDGLMQMCKQISKLQALQKLKLHFQIFGQVSKSSKVLNFIPYLSDVFKKPIKIKTLLIRCRQLDPSEALQSLVSALGNSAAFLTHLKIDFPALPCTHKTYRLIIKLMKNLANIQVLEIPCLAIGESTSHFLNDLTNAVCGFKYLRVFTIGEIKANVNVLNFYNAMETISSKRGLRQFDCNLSYDFQENLRNKENFRDLDLEKILRENPYFENLTLLNDFSLSSFDLFRWTED